MKKGRSVKADNIESMTMNILNPVSFAEEVNSKYLKYQLTAFPIADPELQAQAYQQLTGMGNASPLIKGPYLSLSRAFMVGSDLEELAKDGIVHPRLPRLAEYHRMFMHQDKALRAILDGKHTLISTGTGSGKTESFLYPILDHCLRLNEQSAKEGISAIIVYPMNALAIDQRNRLRELLAGSGISFGLYIGSTAATSRQGADILRMHNGDTRNDYHQLRDKNNTAQIIPVEERSSEEEIRKNPPRILLTNVKQLELLMTRPNDIGLFIESALRFMVFDEVHTYSGVAGAEVSCLIRRMRTLCGKNADEVICVGTSATIVDPKLGEEAGREFASQFFGVNPQHVALVKEEYNVTDFPAARYTPVPPEQDTAALLMEILEAVELQDEEKVGNCVSLLTGVRMERRGLLAEDLYEHLIKNEYVHYIHSHFIQPGNFDESLQKLLIAMKRKQILPGSEERNELLCYLALGASAVKDGNPLLRPKLHYFVKGIEDGVVTFVPKRQGDAFKPRLFLSAEEAREVTGGKDESLLPLFVCKNCGQHYYEKWYDDLKIARGNVSGGRAEKDNTIWEKSDSHTAVRTLLTDTLITDDEEEISTNDRRFAWVWFCVHCGTVHKNESESCLCCASKHSLQKLMLILKVEDGLLSSCVSCGTIGRSGGRNIEPIRPLRATTVSDVHILAQNMINAAPKESQKLIVFSDNRQDAAFQAGWMQDHARRYRFRHLMYEFLLGKKEPVSLNDMQQLLYEKLTADRSLGRLLAPEVYEVYSEEAFSREFEERLRYYLRIQIIRELSTAYSQKECLESWGLLKIVYAKLDPHSSEIRHLAGLAGLTPEEVVTGIELLLDKFRRSRMLHHRDAPIYSRTWYEGDPEIQNGFLPLMMGGNGKPLLPVGLSFEPEISRNNLKKYFLSRNGRSSVEEFVAKWGIAADKKSGFLSVLWDFLTVKTGLLEKVSFTTSKGKEMDTGSPIYQVNMLLAGMVASWKRYRCNVCQRVHTRPAPGLACSSYNCKGKMQETPPPENDYSISLMQKPFSMVMPHEHSAQVPAQEREMVENEFKKPDGRFNVLVATPTLELGVNIGALDMVLMRNMPPTPSNYWQRAGRAGRKHRIAVMFTYTRRSEHDQYFFKNPELMLGGSIPTPKFNLQNQVLIRKHIASTVLSELHKIRIKDNLTAQDRNELERVLGDSYPIFIRDYLFEEGERYRQNAPSFTDLQRLLEKYTARIFAAVDGVFRENRPVEQYYLTSAEALKKEIDHIPDGLERTVRLLFERMMWAKQTMDRLSDRRRVMLLKEDLEKILQRCTEYLKHLSMAESGNYTLSVLAEEGFLPGYGLYDSGIKALAYRHTGIKRGKHVFELSRSRMMAVREYVPGNMIYANGNKYKCALYQLPLNQDDIDISTITYFPETDSVSDAVTDAYQSRIELSSIPISDCDITQISRISDEENNRFQMRVKSVGKLHRVHRGGRELMSGRNTVKLIFGQKITQMNLGPADLVAQEVYGYPLCTVCGAVRSPYSSIQELNSFSEHHEKSCNRKTERLVFTAQDMVDGIRLDGISDAATAQNLGEALVVGATRRLAMERGDLSILVTPESDKTVTLFIYDPMPGGSGLLNQMIDLWKLIVDSAVNAMQSCDGLCEKSCYKCLRTYYNTFYHKLLDRGVAAAALREYSYPLEFKAQIPAMDDEITAAGQGAPTNTAEKQLELLFKEWGLPTFDQQVDIALPPPVKNTVPDFVFRNDQQNITVTVYLDGLSRTIHGNEERQRIDAIINTELELLGYEVVRIPASALSDPQMLLRYRKLLLRKLRLTTNNEK